MLSTPAGFFCRFSDLITIFDIRTEENLDKKILAALLKGDELRLQSQVKFEEDKNNLFQMKQFTLRNSVSHCPLTE